jgi:hypothetical protein
MAPITRIPAWTLCTLSASLLLLAGCDKFTGGKETDWARAALERNPDLTIVASDADAKTFTVQVKGSNELRVVRVDQLIGNVPSDGVAPTVSDPAPAVPSTPAVADATAAPEGTAPGTDPSRERSSEQVDARVASSGLKTGLAPGGVEIKNSKTGEVLASGDAANISAAPAGDGATSATPAGDKSVLASGPGYSITAGDASRGKRALRLAEATELKPAASAVERRYEPMICQGNRLVHIDGRNLEFEGDAIAALDGCEIHITNSHIIAHGLGLSARAANVHIKNSVIEGDAGSVSASEGAKVYTQQSTFKGLSRRLDSATFTDLGGTTWN